MAMTVLEGEIKFTVEVLAQEIDCKTPDTPATAAANRKLAEEFVAENIDAVAEAIGSSRLPDGDLNPYGLTKRLLAGFLTHLHDRVRPDFPT